MCAPGAGGGDFCAFCAARAGATAGQRSLTGRALSGPTDAERSEAPNPDYGAICTVEW